VPGTDPAGQLSVQRFYDDLAGRYHLVYPDWEAAIERQGQALSELMERALGAGRRRVLDCACGIGTQAIGLARRGHRVAGADLSVTAVRRAAREARERDVRLAAVGSDMRAIPFRDGTFDVVVCADNALPHLLTGGDMDTALTGMRRALRPGGLLIVSTRDYDADRPARPQWRPPLAVETPAGRAITFHLWHWHPDAERYDVELFQLLPRGSGRGDDWDVHVVRATYWAIGREQVTERVAAAGFRDIAWLDPAESGFFQPVLTARG
jgi:SAM-dependent methyltransferase